MMLKRICYLITALLLFSSVNAQELDTLSFENIGVSEGLSNNSVTCLIQDRYGLIWIGTYDGLNRFDGTDFDVFRNRLRDSFSLVNNHVNAIAEGIDGDLWVGTQMGFVKFNYRDFRFYSTYYIPEGERRALKVRARVRDVIADSVGNVLVATENCGLLFKSDEDKVFKQILATGDGNTARDVTAMCRFGKGRYLVYLKDEGLYVFSCKIGKLQKMACQFPSATRLLFEPKFNRLLIGTEDGLYIGNLKSGVINTFSPVLAHCNITNLLKDRGGTLWISTDGNGLAFLKENGNVAKDLRFIREGRQQNQLKSAAVYSVYEDDKGRKWISTLRGGVSLLHNRNSHFYTISRNELNPNSLASNFILSFCEDKLHNIWVGTDGGGLSYWDPNTNIFENYKHYDNDPMSLSGNYVVSILKDHQDNIWVASFNGGIDKLTSNGKDFVHYRCFNPYKQAETKNFWKLFEDSHNRIWLGSTLGDVMFKYNRLDDKFEVYDTALVNIHTIYEDKSGTIWLGNYDQLIQLDTSGQKHHKFIHVGYPVRAILEDSRGRLWVGTEGGGLMLYNPDSESLKAYTMENGFSSNSILNLLLDKKGRIWCSTYNGLSVFNPDSKVVYNFYAHDGLQSNQFNYNASLALSNGKFLFGGIHGFNVFVPEEINKIVPSVNVVVTSFKIDNVPIQQSGLLPSGTSPVDFKSLTLPFSRANFSVRFAGLNYDAPKSLQYGYYLEGWDNGWTNIGNMHTISYARLYGGHYILHMAIMQPNGKPLLSTERTIAIHVLPPWYSSLWAYLFYVAVVCGLVFAYLKYRQNRTRLLYEMKLTRINANAERELNERKIAFFTNISHEFRTMLTLIINPIKELMSHADEVSQPDTIRTAYKNSKRMLGLIGQLLLFRKADKHETQLHICRLDLNFLCREVYDSFTYQAKSQNIEYGFEADRCLNIGSADENRPPLKEEGVENVSGEDYIVYGDAEKIEILLFNIISNAFKYTNSGGAILIKLRNFSDRVEVHVGDSGKGIPQEEKEKVFQKFYQRHTGDGRAKAGFGIGLFLVKEFVALHHGTVDFESEIGKGTTFKIVLPKGKTHFIGEAISDSMYKSIGLAEEILDDPMSGDNLNKFNSGAIHDTRTNPSKGETASEIMARNQLENMIFDEERGTAASTGQKTVLIADDNDGIRDFVRRIFKDDYYVLAAGSGDEALELIYEALPDLVILDLVMPGRHGDEICQIIKQSSNLSHIPVIILTAEESSEVKIRCVESGADDYITKPFEKELLAARVNNLLKVKSNLQKYFYNEIPLQEGGEKISANDKEFLDACIAVIEEHLEDDMFKIQVLADEMCMSHSGLYKKIHTLSGYSVAGFVRFVRLRKAAELFVNSQNNVNQIALLVGFNDIKYFRSQFQKLFNMSPSSYIKKFRKTCSVSKGDDEEWI